MNEIKVDVEKVIRGLDNIDKVVNELRNVLTPAAFKRADTSPQASRESTDIMVLNLNLSQILFKVKGGAAASDYDGFAFTFLRKARDGPIWEHNIELHNALCQYGRVQVGSFVYQLSKDGVFVQRVIAKG